MGILLILILAACIIFAITRSHRTAGEQGEDDVVAMIERAIRRGMYGKILRNVYIPKANGGTTEIDILFISVKGIFVFESKNYAGYIFGNGEHKNWTVTLYAGKNWVGRKQTEKHQFYNPIWQNRGHISNLKRLISPSIPVRSVIVFSDRSEFKGIEYDSDKCEVLHTSDVFNYLQTFQKYQTNCISVEEVNRIYYQLVPYTQKTAAEKQVHVEQVIGRLQDTSTCPFCGGKLVLRAARKGPDAGQQFYGCSNYPKCRFTRKA